jgi:hypothetical protein
MDKYELFELFLAFCIIIASLVCVVIAGKDARLIKRENKTYIIWINIGINNA